ncbi:hypothetical protein [Sphingomonas sp. OTU376]|uniref:hypothetical protein n=1 Tax=Sphingomonas sp. OTU376 TaxID=3043863 RepID=UPI00313E88A2
MARLKAMPSRLGAMPARLKAPPKRAEGFYQSAEWANYRRRHAAWTREQKGALWCARCGSTHRLILDHIVERRDGGPDFPPFEGAEWLCAAHHNAKTAAARAERVRSGGA